MSELQSHLDKCGCVVIYSGGERFCSIRKRERPTTKVALGAVMIHAPAVTDLDQDPLEMIEPCNRVKVDGEHGIVEVIKKD